MKKHSKKLLALVVVLTMCLSVVGTAVATTGQKALTATYKDINITLNGKDVQLKDVNGNPVEPFVSNGTTYVPVRAVSEALDLNVKWDAANTEVQLTTNSEPTELCYANTKNGGVMGYKWAGTNYFYGIPYAQAKRFHMPEAPESWTGYKTCMMQGEVAPQNKTTMEQFDFMAYSREMVENEETCLNLNVMTPELTGNKPVIVWMHGGGFETGGSLEKTIYDGGNIAKFGDVVFVSVNHRLNCLGYLDLSAYGDEYKYSGNAGQADLVFALQWVKDNIASFGGNPNNVTIVGQSGGGTKVTTLMGMPAAKGLFHKAMAISGGSAKVTRTTETAQADTEKVLKILGITAKNIKDIETVDYVKLYEACQKAGIRSYGPVVDGDYYPTGTYEMSKDIPFVCGNVLGEFSTNIGNIIFSGAGGKGAIESNVLTNIPESEVLKQLTAKYDGNADLATKTIAAFKTAYPGHNVAEVLYINNRATGMSSYSLAEAMASYGGTVYQYVQACPYPMFGGVVPIHTASDIPMWFHNDEMIPAWTAGDEATFAKLSDEMAGALCALAKTGSPNQSNLPWTAWNAETDNMMVFDHESGMRNHHEDALFELLSQMKASGGFPF